MAEIIINLEHILNDLGITKNKLAVEAKLRPNLISELVEGKTKAVKLDTLAKILETLNRLSREQGLSNIYDVGDLFSYNEHPTE